MNCPSCGYENIDGSDRCENCLTPFRDLDVPRADSAEGLARSVMEDNLSRLDAEEPICVSPATPAIEVARRMKDANAGCALVLDGPKLVGIFTEHDVLLKMTGQIFDTLKFVQPGNAVIEEMGINEMPSSDIPVEEMRADATQFDEGPAQETNQPAEGSPHLGANLRVRNLQVPVKDLMSPNPETLHQQDSVAAALNKMSLGRYRHLPVRKNDGGYTLASIKSVLKYIAKEDW